MMRCIPSAASVTISATSIYFALIWGADGLQVLADQLHGLDRPALIAPKHQGLAVIAGTGDRALRRQKLETVSIEVELAPHFTRNPAGSGDRFDREFRQQLGG